MGKVYTAPEGFETPKFNDMNTYSKRCDEYVAKLQAWAKENGSGPEAGKIVRFNVADGYAQYIVFSLKPVKLIHIDTMDAYQFQYANRLTAGDIREKIRQEEAMEKMFSKNKS